MNNTKKNFSTMEDFCALSLEQRFAKYIDFVAAQPPNKGYSYFDPLKCPLAQFAASLDFYKNNINLKLYGFPAGKADATAIKYCYVNGEVEIVIIPERTRKYSLHILCDFPQNFGALHERLAIHAMSKWEFTKYLTKRFVKRIFGYV